LKGADQRSAEENVAEASRARNEHPLAEIVLQLNPPDVCGEIKV
jgi:hypothetical protein